MAMERFRRMKEARWRRRFGALGFFLQDLFGVYADDH